MSTAPHDDSALIQASQVVVRAGLLSLSAGTGSYRVKETMRRVSLALGIERHHAHVTLTEITSTSHRGPIFRTEVAETRAIGVNASRLQQLQDLTHRLQQHPGPVTPEHVAAELDTITRQPPLHHPVLNALSAGGACASMSFLTGGGPIAILSALLAAATSQYLRRNLAHRGYNQLSVTVLAATLASALYLLLAAGSDAVLHHHGSPTGYVAAVLFLLPGFPLVTAGLDLARLDLSAGITRLTYALMLTMSAGLVVATVSTAVHLTPAHLQAPVPITPLELTLRAVASFVGAASLAIMFNGTWRMAGLAGSCCLIANMLRLHLLELAWSSPVATTAATLVVGFLTGIAAPRLHVPRITISVPAVLIMMPGALIYHAVYTISQGDTSGIITSVTQAALTIAAIPFGIVVARSFTDKAWAFDR